MQFEYLSEKCHDVKLLSSFGAKGKHASVIGRTFGVGPVHTFLTREGLHLWSRTAGRY